MGIREQEIEEAIKESKGSRVKIYILLAAVVCILIFSFLVLGSTPHETGQTNALVAASDDVEVTEDSGATVINVLANDVNNGDNIRIISVTQGGHGSVAITNSGTDVTYTPDTGFSGTDSFTYSISDDSGKTATSTVHVTLTARTPCSGIVCNSPPSSMCTSNSLLRVYESQGVCSDGVCDYLFTDTTCASGCSNNQCNNDSCAGVTCTSPSPICVNSTVRRTYTSTCSNGSCVNTSTDIACQSGLCSAGNCTNPCSGVVCNSPPSNKCIGNNSVIFNSTGICGGGFCRYSNTSTVCTLCTGAGICGNNSCTPNPCTSFPASTCANSTVIINYTSPGACTISGSSFSCNYTSSSIACASQICNGTARLYGGACSGGACLFTMNDSCTSSPAATCLNATTLRNFTSAGCSGGSCQYPSTDTSCQFGCSNGSCSGDSCSGISCNNPPSPTCSGNNLITYNSPGTCSGGICGYTNSTQSCQFGCSNGQCNANPLKEFNATATRFSFNPSTITVNKDDHVVINVHNIDTVTHGFTIAEYSIIESIDPGQTKTISFTANQTGQFRFFCSVFCGSGHPNMNGTLTVNP